MRARVTGSSTSSLLMILTMTPAGLVCAGLGAVKLPSMTEREDHDQLADDLERRADRLEQESERLGGEIGDVRDDWRRKQDDAGVPGAVVPEDPDAARGDAKADGGGGEGGGGEPS
jgi:hypothetical protein